jgi:hypothetical protein
MWLAAIIPSAFGLAAAVLGLMNRKKLQEVHVLVNSRLDATLTEIADLKKQRDLKASDEAGR